jgi:hypothetical protein
LTNLGKGVAAESDLFVVTCGGWELSSAIADDQAYIAIVSKSMPTAKRVSVFIASAPGERVTRLSSTFAETPLLLHDPRWRRRGVVAFHRASMRQWKEKFPRPDIAAEKK